MAEKENNHDLHEDSIEDQNTNRSPGPLRTDVSNSTA